MFNSFFSIIDNTGFGLKIYNKKKFNRNLNSNLISKLLNSTETTFLLETWPENLVFFKSTSFLELKRTFLVQAAIGFDFFQIFFFGSFFITRTDN